MTDFSIPPVRDVRRLLEGLLDLPSAGGGQVNDSAARREYLNGLRQQLAHITRNRDARRKAGDLVELTEREIARLTA
jgi:hypothetical protein